MRAQDNQHRRSEPSRGRRRFAMSAWSARVRLPIVSAAIVGLIWSAAAFVFVWRWENTLAQNELVSASRSQFLAVQNGLDDYMTKLMAVRAFFEASDDVSRAEFGIFPHQILR